MSQSAKIVETLLEAERACAWCQKEHGIRPQQGQTHGFCKRHMLQHHSQDLTPEDISDLQSRPDDYFAPDMGEFNRERVMAAEALVSRLLGENRACANCEKQLGVRSPEGTSHGICRRHALETQQKNVEFAVARAPHMVPAQQRKLEDIKAQSDEHFAPDMAQQQQAA
jgi:hypothetical protein